MKNVPLFLLFLSVLQINFTDAAGQNEKWTSARPDGHAPASIMGDHYHAKGQIMFSYRYMPMWMNGNLSSTNEISDNEIFQDYMVAPYKMAMQMHMVGIMYAPVNAFTIMIMVDYVHSTMDLNTKAGTDFTTSSDGLGDISIMGLIKIMNTNRQSLHGTLGISMPTGSIDQRDNTPTMDDAQLAYPMQLGSGTWDPVIGATYLGEGDLFSWGGQIRNKFRLTENKKDYQLGNDFGFSAWGAIKASGFLSFSASVNYKKTGKVGGADPDLNPMMMPLFNTINSGREQLNLGLGSNLYVPRGKFKDLRLGLEIDFPLMQHVNGIQMRNSMNGTIALQYTIEN